MNFMAGCYVLNSFIVTGQKCTLKVSAVNKIFLMFVKTKDDDDGSSVHLLSQASWETFFILLIKIIKCSAGDYLYIYIYIFFDHIENVSCAEFFSDD